MFENERGCQCDGGEILCLLFLLVCMSGPDAQRSRPGVLRDEMREENERLRDLLLGGSQEKEV